MKRGLLKEDDMAQAVMEQVADGFPLTEDETKEAMERM